MARFGGFFIRCFLGFFHNYFIYFEIFINVVSRGSFRPNCCRLVHVRSGPEFIRNVPGENKYGWRYYLGSLSEKFYLIANLKVVRPT